MTRPAVSTLFAKVVYRPPDAYEIDGKAVQALAASARDTVYLADVRREVPAILLGDVAIVFPGRGQVAVASVAEVAPTDTLTVLEAAWMLGVTPDWVRKLCQKGILPARRGPQKGEWLIPAASLGDVQPPR